MQEMSKIENCHRPKNMPGRTNPAKLTDQEKSDRMIEIPLSTQTDASNVIPDAGNKRIETTHEIVMGRFTSHL